MVLRQGAIQYALGAGLGLGLTLATAILARSAIGQSALLFDVSPTDPPTYLGVAVLLALVAFAATIVPARRATRVDPMIALRAE